jgi:hypothetical protein
MADPMYSTDQGAEEEMPEPGDVADDQEPEDRSPRPGNAPVPGQRPSESGSTPSDIETHPQITGDAEEEDETGAPERVARPDDEHPLESPEALRQPRDGSDEDTG